MTSVMDSFTPAEATELCSRVGVKKANMRIDKIFFSAVYAGMLLSFAGATHLSIQASPWFQDNAPGLIRAIGATYFPYGLVMIVLTGTDLSTGSFMYTTLSFIHGRISVFKMLQHWFLTFFGNLAGSLFMVAIIFGYGGVFDSGAYVKEAMAFAVTKQVVPKFHQIFLRAIGCNWLVCLACYLGVQGRDLVSKILGIWWPITAFVSLGLDHVVANMFLVPIGIWHHAPGLTVGLYIWKGIIPAALGNILGGGLFCAGVLWYLHIEGEPEIAVNGVYYEATVNGHGHINGGLRFRRNAGKQEEEYVSQARNPDPQVEVHK
ncbi:putative formate/nitrite transporter [Rhizodiscina lignyota]|uniref:Formate/nitrite transporter n=1 Tax=Rhizodiscina lignyota TaxID=1504668 RepID=A0A9P4LZE3_9PEZI|nr:putative formate/nitrite transporter [Rhizodiscina lignyota]